MPNYEKSSQKSNFIDISSNKQVKKLYNKKGRLKKNPLSCVFNNLPVGRRRNALLLFVP